MASNLPVDSERLPVHIGIIMDGNGRWARRKNMPRTQGHLEGLKAAKRVVQAAADLGIRYLTLYTFSTENWKRAEEEVGFIMGLVKKYLMAEIAFYKQNRIRIRHAGDLDGLPADVASEIRQVCRETESFTGTTVVLALNYGGRDEIVRAVRRLLSGMDGAALTETALTETAIASALDNPDIPDPDLIIRPAAEFRSSNFLLWQSAYSEFFFSEKYWPDWTEEDLRLAVADYQRRERRFGGVGR